MLDEVFEHVRAAEIPEFLRRSNVRKSLELIVPRSCRRRLGPVLRAKLRKRWQLWRRMLPLVRSLPPVFWHVVDDALISQSRGRVDLRLIAPLIQKKVKYNHKEVNEGMNRS
jgi:hypothetical protein